MVRNTFYILNCGFAFFTLIFAFSYPLYAVRYISFCPLPSVFCRLFSTTVENPLQIHPFLTNKANFQKVKFNVNRVLTMNYGKIDTWSNRKNKANSKPIQTQYKPNLLNPLLPFNPSYFTYFISLWLSTWRSQLLIYAKNCFSFWSKSILNPCLTDLSFS